MSASRLELAVRVSTAGVAPDGLRVKRVVTGVLVGSCVCEPQSPAPRLPRSWNLQEWELADRGGGGGAHREAVGQREEAPAAGGSPVCTELRVAGTWAREVRSVRSGQGEGDGGPDSQENDGLHLRSREKRFWDLEQLGFSCEKLEAARWDPPEASGQRGPWSVAPGVVSSKRCSLFWVHPPYPRHIPPSPAPAPTVGWPGAVNAAWLVMVWAAAW